MTAEMQTVLILQQRAVSDQHLVVKNRPLSQEVLHPENSPSLSQDFYSQRQRKNDDPQIPNSHQTRKPGKLWKFKNLQILEGVTSSLSKSGLVCEESWRCAQPLPVEDDSLTVFIRRVLCSLCTTNTWTAYTGATSR